MARDRKTNISNVVQKNYEISKSLQVNWISAVLFGIFSLINVPFAILNPSLLQGVIAVLITANLWISIRNILELRLLRRNLIDDPEKHMTRSVRQPLLYRAVFWYLPK